MTGLVNVLVIVAVIALFVVRQCSAQRISGDRRWWVLPGVLMVMALREPGLLDPHHEALSVLVLGAGLAVGVVTGAGWAWTTRIRRAEDGTLWGKGNGATPYVWCAGLALRAGLYGLSAAMGIHLGAAALVMALAATLLVRGGILASRAAGIPEPCHGSAEGMGFRPAWKDRV
nr:DUF1453 domain-containing protein [Streptomyces sp. NBC_00995]